MKETIIKLIGILAAAFVMESFISQGISPYPFIAGLLAMIAIEV